MVRRSSRFLPLLTLALAACGGSHDTSDAGHDAGAMDVSVADAAPDATADAPADAPPADAAHDAAVDTGPTCAAPLALCGAACVDTRNDPANCGACGTACSAGQVCGGGSCGVHCPTGQTNCNGACATLESDSAHCGACDTACPAGQACMAGACAPSCATGTTACGAGADARCTDTQTDNANCGACGTACPAGQACTSGACVVTCGAGLTVCGSGAGAYCANTQSDNANCGACGTTCPAGRACASGACAVTCGAGQTACGSGASARCTDTQTDNANCGACGTACPVGLSCTAGACACRATPEVLDQSQLAGINGQGVSYPTVIGQTFVVGRSGALTAIEVGVWANPPCPASDGAVLTLYRGATAIGTARLGCAALPSTRPSGLSGTTRTGAVFDLSASCAAVTAGETLSFRIAPDAPPPPSGSCSGPAGVGTCTSGPGAGRSCLSDNDCTGWSIGVAESLSNPYAGGDMSYGGGTQTGVDMAFKTFVR